MAKNKTLKDAFPDDGVEAGTSKSPDAFGFESTMWTELVHPAGSPDEDVRVKALGRLLQKYQVPLKNFLAHVTRKSRSDDWIDDCFQAFVAEKIVGRNLVRTANKDRGKFRRLLKTSLYHFAVQIIRQDTRDRSVIVPLIDHAMNNDMDDSIDPRDLHLEEIDPVLSGDILWAYEVLRNALDMLKTDCLKKKHPLHLIIFSRRRLPILFGDPEIESLQETADFLRSTLLVELSWDEVSNRQKTTERSFLEKARLVISEYSDSAEAIATELRQVCDLLLHANPMTCYQELRNSIRQTFTTVTL